MNFVDWCVIETNRWAGAVVETAAWRPADIFKKIILNLFLEISVLGKWKKKKNSLEIFVLGKCFFLLLFFSEILDFGKYKKNLQFFVENLFVREYIKNFRLFINC